MGVRRGDTIQETKLQFSRATMAHFVHIPGILDPLVTEKKGDAGKPALHETLVQTDKGPCGKERGQSEQMPVSHPAVTSCQMSGNCSRGLETWSMSKMSKHVLIDCSCVGGCETVIRDRLVVMFLDWAISCGSYETQVVWSSG